MDFGKATAKYEKPRGKGQSPNQKTPTEEPAPIDTGGYRGPIDMENRTPWA